MIREHASCLFRSPPIEVCGDAPAPVPFIDPTMWPVALMAVVIVGLIAIVCAAGARPR